jgi:hypothetical protein
MLFFETGATEPSTYLPVLSTRLSFHSSGEMTFEFLKVKTEKFAASWA